MRDNETSQFYDLRGDYALNNTPTRGYGSSSVDTRFAAPYIELENQLRLLALNSNTKNEIKFLDLCCGTGRLSIFPAKLGFDVHGIDLSEKSVEAAKKLATKHCKDLNCSFETCDALNFLDEHPGEFDVILISGSAYYFNDEVLLNKVSKALKVGGHFFAIETNGSNFLLNQYRKIKNLLKNNRDKQTLTQLKTAQQVQHWKSFFSRSEIHMFDLVTPIATSSLNKAARWTDKFLLQAKPLHSFSFKFFFHGIK